jgi:hypothetical protein
MLSSGKFFGLSEKFPPYCLDPSENCQCCRKISNDWVGGGGEDFKMLSSAKIFDLSEKFFGLSEKYCPWPPHPPKHCSHGATADH